MSDVYSKLEGKSLDVVVLIGGVLVHKASSKVVSGGRWLVSRAEGISVLGAKKWISFFLKGVTGFQGLVLVFCTSILGGERVAAQAEALSYSWLSLNVSRPFRFLL